MASGTPLATLILSMKPPQSPLPRRRPTKDLVSKLSNSSMCSPAGRVVDCSAEGSVCTICSMDTGLYLVHSCKCTPTAHVME